MCESLHGIKVPSGYSSNIRRLVSMKDLKLVGMKSHDCHVMMTQMLPVAIRGVLPDKVRDPIIRLCSFFNTISKKAINPQILDKLQKDVVITMCRFEMCFPPSFFVIMFHLIVHIVKQIKFLGPVFLHQMYPFERFMGVVKKYVRNRGRPEGCIAEGWATEEVIEFCIDYMDLNPIGLPVSRHEGRLRGTGTLGLRSFRCNDNTSCTQAHFAVLNHSEVAHEYIGMHKAKLLEENPSRGQGWLDRQHRNNFGSWLKKHMIHAKTDSAQLRALANGPSTTLVSFEAYDINGYTFYTRSQDSKSANQNSGVAVEAYNSKGDRDTYYGIIEQILELDYGSLKVPLFRCQWVALQGGVKIDKYGMTIVDLKRVAYREEPYVIADVVSQVFFVKDPSNRDRHVVLQGKRSIVGVENVTDEEEYNQLDEVVTLAEIPNVCDVEEDVYLRSDHNEGRVV